MDYLLLSCINCKTFLINIAMIAYNWVITGLDVAPSWNGLTNVVRTIHARYVGTDTDTGTSSFVTVSCDMPDPYPNHYARYENLTENSTIGWLELQCDVSALQNILNIKLNPQNQPAVLTMTPPWENQ